ncbi:MAG: SGNH/GDSL hydrolase family protein [Clostridia bacterium]|nr:SGNH/GDSL hydrolase family protein [Clostridia bacterium]
MKFIEKLKEKNEKMSTYRQPTIVCFGDSVTQGCFEVFRRGKEIDTVFEPMEGYVEKLRKLLSTLFPMASPVVINAGRSGGRAETEAKRLERDVLSFQPDLVIVCFGLNDATRGKEEIARYVNALTEIFEKVQASGAELIFMTPNLRCTEIDYTITDEKVVETAERIAKSEKNGDLAFYLDAARAICKEKNIPVCDCNRIWEKFRDGGVDIQLLLSNKINHPTRDMHMLFAYELLKTIFAS